MREGYGVCPVCNGTCRVKVPESMERYKNVIAGYDKESDTLACNNCGAQTMYGRATGEARLRKDGTPCKHEYTSTNVGRCLTRYTCKHCDSSYEIDSGD